MLSKKKNFALLTFTVCVAYAYDKYFNYIKSPIVETQLGKLQGFESKSSRGGKTFYSYLGIQYAKQLRFELPQPLEEKWSGVRDAIYFGPKCAQYEIMLGVYLGEDACLTLNIYVPKVKSDILMPVLVYIPGGAFLAGSADIFGPDYFFDDEIDNVIIVTLNYRVGALGFLSTGDKHARGNQGLKDQVMALKYLQANIRAFGGDSSKVTLWGQSAGSVSCSYHILSPMSKGLFSRAILQSGVANSPWGLTTLVKDFKWHANQFAEKVGCGHKDSKEMIKCLKTVDASTLIRGHRDIKIVPDDLSQFFLPIVETIHDENTFLGEHPMKILASGNFNKVPVMSGYNSQEGLLPAALILSNQSRLDEANKDFNSWISTLYAFSPEKANVSSALRKFYFGDRKNIADINLAQNYIELFTDGQFLVPLHRYMKYYHKHAPIKLYMYNHKGKFSMGRFLVSNQKPYFPVIVNVALDFTVQWIQTNIFKMELPHPGVGHFDEVVLLLRCLFADVTKNSKDYQISKELVQSFAKFANSRDDLTFRGVEWKTINPSDKNFKFLRIEEESPAMINDNLILDRVKFWETLGILV